jgi:glycosyltransferase involved in cell wall biosynthesis
VKILLLAEVSVANVSGGAERVLRQQALGLSARGHAVRILARMPVEGDPLRVEVDGITEIRFAVNRRNASSFFFSTLRNIKHAWSALVREWIPDVIVAYQALPALAVPGRISRPPFVYVCLSLAHEEFETRNSPQGGITGKIWHRVLSLSRRWTERTVVSRAQRLIVLSDFMRRRVLDCHRVRADCIRMVPGGVDSEVFSPCQDRRSVRATLGLEEGAFILFTVRNLVPRMGLSELIHAILRLRKEIHGLLLLVGGSGPLRSELEAQVKTLGLDGCVRLIGFIPEAKLPDYYRAADLFVLPTAQLEGFGLVTVEALASGTPVFGTPIGATEEILDKLDHSLVAKRADSESLAVGIAALYRRFTTDPNWRVRLVEEGRALVLRDYTWARHCEQLETVLSEVISSPSRRNS